MEILDSNVSNKGSCKSCLVKHTCLISCDMAPLPFNIPSNIPSNTNLFKSVSCGSFIKNDVNDVKALVDSCIFCNSPKIVYNIFPQKEITDPLYNIGNITCKNCNKAIYFSPRTRIIENKESERRLMVWVAFLNTQNSTFFEVSLNHLKDRFWLPSGILIPNP